MKKTVCILDENPNYLNSLTGVFQENGWHSISSDNSYSVLPHLKVSPPRFFVLGHIPQKEEIVSTIREQFPNSRIICLLSDNDCPAHVMRAFQIGVYDCFRKPMDYQEILVRINQVLVRENVKDNSDIVLRDRKREFEVAGEVVYLTQREFQIVKSLVNHKGRVVSREEIIKASSVGDISPRNIDVHMVSLRKKVECLGLRIETLRGIGYRLTA